MSQNAEFLIVQHLSDPFRREAKNIGIFVRMGTNLSAKFFGETAPGDVDGRRIRMLPSPAAYSQWIKYWRRTMQDRPGVAWDEVQKTARHNYQVVQGGSLDGVGGDTLDQVITYLYSALVSEGGISAALGAPDEAVAVVRLTESIEQEFKSENLLAMGGPLFDKNIKNPIQRDAPVEGERAKHILSFVQRNGHPIVMEPIDLGAARDKSRMKDRAGWASFVFEDILKKNRSAETVAVISATVEDEKQDTAKYALALLKTHATDIVNWQSRADRERFIAARKATAINN